MKKILVLAALAAMSLVGNAHADLVAHWNFNSLSIATASAPGVGGVPTSIASNSGSATLSLTGWTGLVDDFAGSTLNAQFLDPAEESLSLISNAGNNSFIQLSFSMSGFTDLEVAFATRGTASGFDSGLWSYSSDGVNFTDLGVNTATRTTTYGIASFSTSALDNQGTAFLRYTLSGATSTTGNNRIENLTLTAVPEPGSAAVLLGSVIGFGLLRRRR
jgi:hypothetical protein